VKVGCDGYKVHGNAVLARNYGEWGQKENLDVVSCCAYRDINHCEYWHVEICLFGFCRECVFGLDAQRNS
jgi:hypothetical protein